MHAIPKHKKQRPGRMWGDSFNPSALEAEQADLCEVRLPWWI